MKICKLISGVLVSLLFSAATIATDSKYPATDFQPKVLYQDTDYKHSKSSSSNPKSKDAVSVVDSSYPAANFEPKVLYQDKEYKPRKDSGTTSSSVAGSSTDNDVQADDEKTSLSITLGLLAAAIVGFILYQKGVQSSSVKNTGRVKVKTSDSGGLSGVARYLATKVGLAPSGVSRYLETRASDQTSGVEKYVAQQKISARLAVAENASGVEKYLKDRG